MADVFDKKKRSEIMASVRGWGNKATEGRLAFLFRRHGLKGWRRHSPLPGKPDFAFHRQRVAVFVDGCFWHGCARHLRMPAANRGYWLEKISRNRLRDRKTDRQLSDSGWLVVRIWGHEFCSKEHAVIARVADALTRLKKQAISKKRRWSLTLAHER